MNYKGDYGSSVFVSEGSTHIECFGQTKQYNAPEQISGFSEEQIEKMALLDNEQKSTIMKARDVFSMGITIYEYSALRHPFIFEGDNKDTDTDIEQMILNEDPIPLPDWINKKIRDLIMSMLNKDALKRPSANDILQNELVKQSLERIYFRRIDSELMIRNKNYLEQSEFKTAIITDPFMSNIAPQIIQQLNERRREIHGRSNISKLQGAQQGDFYQLIIIIKQLYRAWKENSAPSDRFIIQKKQKFVVGAIDQLCDVVCSYIGDVDEAVELAWRKQLIFKLLRVILLIPASEIRYGIINMLFVLCRYSKDHQMKFLTEKPFNILHLLCEILNQTMDKDLVYHRTTIYSLLFLSRYMAQVSGEGQMFKNFDEMRQLGVLDNVAKILMMPNDILIKQEQQQVQRMNIDQEKEKEKNNEIQQKMIIEQEEYDDDDDDEEDLEEKQLLASIADVKWEWNEDKERNFNRGINLTKSTRVVYLEQNSAAQLIGFIYKNRKLDEQIEYCDQFGNLVMRQIKISSAPDQYINDINDSLQAIVCLAENRENHYRILSEDYLESLTQYLQIGHAYSFGKIMNIFIMLLKYGDEETKKIVLKSVNVHKQRIQELSQIRNDVNSIVPYAKQLLELLNV